MRCHEARQLLEHRTDGPRRTSPDPALAAHLQECAECRGHAEELALIRLLRGLPVPPPRKGFAQRALDGALIRASHRGNRRPLQWGLAAAASLVLALLVALQVHLPGGREAPTPGSSGMVTIHAQPGQTRVVDVMLHTPRRLEGAMLVVKLDENLALAGRPGVRELSWQTNLTAGANKLSLPVNLLGSGAEMQIVLRHGDRVQKLTVQVRNSESQTPLSRSSI